MSEPINEWTNEELVTELTGAAHLQDWLYVKAIRKELLRRLESVPASRPASGIYQVEWIDAHTVELTAMAISEEVSDVK